MSTPSVLLINNHPFESGNPGQVDGLRLMERAGEIGAVSVVNAGPRKGESQSERDRRVTARSAQFGSRCGSRVIAQGRDPGHGQDGCGHLQTPLSFTGRVTHGAQASGVGPEMSAWLEAATQVFSVGGPPQVQLLQNQGRQDQFIIRSIPTIMCFSVARSRDSGLALMSEVAFIGSNLSRNADGVGTPRVYGALAFGGLAPEAIWGRIPRCRRRVAREGVHRLSRFWRAGPVHSE